MGGVQVSKRKYALDFSSPLNLELSYELNFCIIKLVRRGAGYMMFRQIVGNGNFFFTSYSTWGATKILRFRENDELTSI